MFGCLVGRLGWIVLRVVGRGGGGFSLLPRRVIIAARTARVKAMSSAVAAVLVALTRAVRAAVWRLSGKGGEWLRHQRPRASPGPAAAGRIPSPPSGVLVGRVATT